MMKHILPYLILVFSNLAIHSYAIEPINLSFTHIGLKEGLSQSTVFSINQDKKGNMWFATYDGVNKYNGYSFTVYQHDAEDEHSIANDIIHTVHVDNHGTLWIGTYDGLSLYDEEKDRFINYYYESKNSFLSVKDIVDLSGTELMVSTTEGLLVFDKKTGQFSNHVLSDVLHRTVASTLYRQDDEIFIGTDHCLYRYTLQNRALEVITRATAGKTIQTVLKQSSTRLWVATEGGGLFCINPVTGVVINYQHQSETKGSISSNYIRSLALDDQDRLWVGTFNDLNIYDEAGDSFISYTSNPLDPYSLSQSSVRSIFKDTQGGIWLGTFFGGLNYYHRLRNQFVNLHHLPYQNKLNDNVVSCMVEDSDKNLWIGTNEGGVNVYDVKKNLFKYYTIKGVGGSAVKSNNIKSIYIDEPADLVYIGTHGGGMSILNRKSGHIETLNSHNSILDQDNVYSIINAGEHAIWIATLAALYHYDTKGRKLQLCKTHTDADMSVGKRIFVLYRDSQSRLWVGGDDGIAVFKQESSTLSHVSLINNHRLLSRTINSIAEFESGKFWIATRGGAFFFDEETGILQHYTTNNGLPNNVVYGILKDAIGRVWMSTNKGLCCYAPETGKFKYYTEADGLQSNQFTQYSFCRTSSGQMYFGGINGITSFMPEMLLDNPYAPPVVFTELKLFNKAVRPDDETGILSSDISNTSIVTLKANQSVFAIEFVVQNYVAGPHNTFAYMLKGYDNQWHETSGQRTVSYSNLPHGKYLFLVKAANNIGKWNDVPTQLEVIILPYWYQTWWAVLLFTLLGIALLFFVFRFVWVRKTMQAALEMERIDKERREEINQMKQRFFIDISHELRTPLTLILSPLQDVLAKVNDRWTHNQLSYIQRNANRLLYLVNQLMDFRRAELGFMMLKVAKEDINKQVKDIFLFYDKIAKRKQIKYHLTSEIEEHETLLYDADFVELILNNLLTNAFKYTDEGGSITISLKKNDNLVIEVSNTGVGIPPDKQEKVFERFYQVNQQKVGSGIGLSLVKQLVELHHGTIELESIENQKTRFTVMLPLNRTAYSENEFRDAEVSAVNKRDTSFIESEMPDDKEFDCPAEDRERAVKEKILVVEDNLEIQHYLSVELGQLFEVAAVNNGAEALVYLKDKETDIVITDVMMPLMDGIKLTKYLKQSIRTCHIPVIILSAKTDVEDQLAALKVGADDYIPKPFTLSLLIAKIQNMLRARRRVYEYYSNTLNVEPGKIAFNAKDQELLEKAVAVVKTNMDNIEFTVDEFAREMNMSRSNLHIKLKSVTGESSIEFIKKIRFAEACSLLEDGRFSIAEVSTKVGFNTPSYFATSFKKHFGCLPTEYAKKRQQ